MEKPRIIVIGSSNTDMILKVPHLPLPGETVLGGEFYTVSGGKGANQAIAAARGGGEVVFLSCIGNDSFGKNALQVYRNEGIDTSCIKIVENVPSGVAIINVADSGENSISVAPGANSQLRPEDIENYKDVIAKGDIVLIQLEIPLETVYRAVHIAYENNVTVILNPAPARVLDEAIFKMVNVITPNEQEAAEIIAAEHQDADHDTLIGKLKNAGLRTIIVTLGANGVLFSEKGKEDYQEGVKVHVLDTTAAGDTFNGYLAVYLAKGASLREAVRIANEAAAISVTRLGASTSIPFLKEVEARMKR